MALIRGNNLTYRYDSQLEPVFEGLSFALYLGARVGLVGSNGAGKTTLFRLILGEITPVMGDISRDKGQITGVLPQEPGQYDGLVLDYLFSAKDLLASLRIKILNCQDHCSDEYVNDLAKFSELGGYEFETQVERITGGLSIDPEILDRAMRDLSGGEKTKVALARILLSEPDLMLLDEPTNHLEIETLEWLEEFLTRCQIPFIVISHDRRFLDNAVDTIWELDSGEMKIYSGNYSFYRQEKETELNRQIQQYEQSKKKIKKLTKAVNSRKGWAFSYQGETGSNGKSPVYEDVTNAGERAMKCAKALESRLKRELEKEEAQKPEIEKDRKLILESDELRNRIILEIDGLSKQYGDTQALKPVSLSINNGDRIGVIGRNGSGKSTMLEILAGMREQTSGTFRWAPKVSYGNYAQEHETLDFSKTIIEEVLSGRYTEQTLARNILGCMNLKDDRVYEEINTLSTGERSKVMLAKILFSSTNVLLLDEPTNHLELKVREAFEKALMDYPGTIILASHDRYFLEKITNRILDLDDGKVFEGGYKEYRSPEVLLGGEDGARFNSEVELVGEDE